VIVVLSLNTAIDRVLQVPGFIPGTVMRAREAKAFAGGKGVNVARNVRRLGLPVRLTGFLGGSPCDLIETQCSDMGIETRWVPIGGETRTCVTVVDSQEGTQTVLNEPGPEVQSQEVEALVAELTRSVNSGDLLCISGSAPPGVPDDLYGQIVREVQARGARVLVDASGAPLRSALHASPWAITPNEDESRTVVSHAGSAVDVARSLSSEAEIVLVTLGRDGCILATAGDVWRVQPPSVQEINAVGSGDAFAAGFLTGIERGETALKATCLAVACGASNAARLEPWIGSTEEVEALERQVRAKQV
jgi:tagatose 6-phosphate kinase